MYLSDRDLTTLLPELRITAPPDAPFVPEEQIQPSSIDLRLGTVFWRPRKRLSSWRFGKPLSIDLRRSKLLEIEPRRYYRREDVAFGKTIIVGPGELLLGRTLERFTVPNGYAAELTGRSSFARLGLMVNATGGFINPGWNGHMPLQLVNFGPTSIRLMPHIPVCQIRLVKLTSLAARPYGDPSLQSIYIEDDGGPSYWWRDKRIKSLHQALAERSVEQAIQEEIYEIIGHQEPEVIERLERFVTRLRTGELQNAAAVLERYSAHEDRRRLLRRWLINVGRACFTVGITASLWVASRPSRLWWHYAVWAASAVLAVTSVFAFSREVGDHFGSSELRKAMKKQS